MKGRRFGRWTVIDGPFTRTYPSGIKRFEWRCSCDCGKGGVVDASTLRRGGSLSCGCLRNEEVSKRFKGKSLSKDHKDKIRIGNKGKRLTSRSRGKLKKAWEKNRHLRVGRNHYEFKERRLNARGYIDIWMPTHPAARRNGRVLEHRLVVEKRIGRYLRKDEIIHHINGIKDDNRDENLAITSYKEHDTKSFIKILQGRVRELEEKLQKVGG
jgi:hypothetical protein